MMPSPTKQTAVYTQTNTGSSCVTTRREADVLTRLITSATAPIDLFFRIADKIEVKDLLVMRLASSKWREVIDCPEFWKRKLEACDADMTKEQLRRVQGDNLLTIINGHNAYVSIGTGFIWAGGCLAFIPSLCVGETGLPFIHPAAGLAVAAMGMLIGIFGQGMGFDRAQKCFKDGMEKYDRAHFYITHDTGSTPVPTMSKAEHISDMQSCAQVLSKARKVYRERYKPNV